MYRTDRGSGEEKGEGRKGREEERKGKVGRRYFYRRRRLREALRCYRMVIAVGLVTGGVVRVGVVRHRTVPYRTLTLTQCE